MTFDDLLNEMEALASQQTVLSKRLVPGDGNRQAEIVFIGEAPGQKEDELQRPFVGAAGKLLSDLLQAIGLKREDVWITNVVKCRPPNNRDPLQEEVDQWWPLLQKELEIINPKIIVMLGRHAMYRFFPNFKISAVHGKAFRRPDGRVYITMYHPAVALYNGSQREVLFQDFKNMAVVLEKLKKIENGELKDEKNLGDDSILNSEYPISNNESLPTTSYQRPAEKQLRMDDLFGN